MNAYPHGAFCWADLNPERQDRAIAFYTDLFGWSAALGDPATGGYATMSLGSGTDPRGVGGGPVAGIAAPMGEGVPPAWTVYFASADAEATVAAVAEHGGAVLQPVTDVPGMGRFAICAEPTGGVFGIWQAKGFAGFGSFGEPGAPCWAEAYSHDAERTRDFFSAVLGLESETIGATPEFTYFQLSIPGQAGPQLGIMQMGEGFPPGVPSALAPYIAVADADAAAEQAKRLGATFATDLMDTGFGRIATLVDLDGAVINVVDRSRAQQPLSESEASG